MIEIGKSYRLNIPNTAGLADFHGKECTVTHKLVEVDGLPNAYLVEVAGMGTHRNNGSQRFNAFDFELQPLT